MLTTGEVGTSRRQDPAGGKARPLLPNWASVVIAVLAAMGVLSLAWSLVTQNRELKQALASVAGNPPAARTPAVRDQLPSIQLSSIAGENRDLLELVGEGAVVAFLTTTCHFCEASLPAWEQAAQDLSAAGTPFVAVSLHSQKQTREYAMSRGVAFPLWTLVDPSERSRLQVSAVPVTAQVSPTGEITRIWRGQLGKEQLGEIVSAATREESR